MMRSVLFLLVLSTYSASCTAVAHSALPWFSSNYFLLRSVDASACIVVQDDASLMALSSCLVYRRSQKHHKDRRCLMCLLYPHNTAFHAPPNKWVSPYTLKHGGLGPPGKHRLQHPTSCSTSSTTLHSGACSKLLYQKADTKLWNVLGSRIPSFSESQWCMTVVCC